MALSTAGVCGSVDCCLLQEVYVGVLTAVSVTGGVRGSIDVTGGVRGSVDCCLLQEVYVGVLMALSTGVCGSVDGSVNRCMWEC